MRIAYRKNAWRFAIYDIRYAVLDMILLAPAKINLSLKITGRDLSDGYHYIDSVFDPVSLYDIIDVKRVKGKGIRIKDMLGKLKGLASQKNIIYKAARLMFSEYKLSGGLSIKLYKHIPHGAGLGGGSSDAAAVMLAIDKMFKLKAGKVCLKKVAIRIGSDVPFFIMGNRARVRGKGEVVVKLKNTRKYWYLLVSPRLKINTKEAYELFDKKTIKNLTQGKSSDKLSNVETFSTRNMSNDFEMVIFEKYKSLKRIKQGLLKTDCEHTAMSGSGSTVFALYKSKIAALSAFKKLNKKRTGFFVCMVHSI